MLRAFFSAHRFTEPVASQLLFSEHTSQQTKKPTFGRIISLVQGVGWRLSLFRLFEQNIPAVHSVLHCTSPNLFLQAKRTVLILRTAPSKEPPYGGHLLGAGLSTK